MHEENNELVSRWLTLKARDADKMNADNDKVLEQKNLKMQKELAEAAREQINIPRSARYGPSFPTQCSA